MDLVNVTDARERKLHEVLESNINTLIVLLSDNLLQDITIQTYCGNTIFLDISRNSFKDISSLWRTFPNLEVLHAESNQLEEISLEKLSKLECLNVKNNSITEVICLPESLKCLNIENNCLQSLVVNSNEIIEINASCNEIKRIRVISKTLKFINLENNLLQSDDAVVPLAKMPELQYINLRENTLSKLNSAKLLNTMKSVELSKPYSKLYVMLSRCYKIRGDSVECDPEVTDEQAQSLEKQYDLEHYFLGSYKFTQNSAELAGPAAEQEEASEGEKKEQEESELSKEYEATVSKVSIQLLNPTIPPISTLMKIEQEESEALELRYCENEIVYCEQCNIPYICVSPCRSYTQNNINELIDQILIARRKESQNVHELEEQFTEYFSLKFFSINNANVQGCQNLLLYKVLANFERGELALPSIEVSDDKTIALSYSSHSSIVTKLEFTKCDLMYINAFNLDCYQNVEFLRIVDCGIDSMQELLAISNYTQLKNLIIADKILDRQHSIIEAILSNCKLLYTLNKAVIGKEYNIEQFELDVQEQLISDIFKQDFAIIELENPEIEEFE